MPVLLVQIDSDFQLILIHFVIFICQREIVPLVQRVGGVGDQLTQKDVPIGINGMDHQIQKTFGFSFKLFLSHSDVLLLALFASDC